MLQITSGVHWCRAYNSVQFRAVQCGAVCNVGGNRSDPNYKAAKLSQTLHLPFVVWGGGWVRNGFGGLFKGSDGTLILILPAGGF